MPIGKDDRNAGFTAFVNVNASMPEPAHIALFLTGDVHQTNELVQAGLVKTSLQVRPGEAIAHTWRNMQPPHRSVATGRREILVEEHSPASELPDRGDHHR